MPGSRLARIGEWIARIEDVLLAVLMFGLVGVSCLQIVRRAVLNDGWIHADAIGRTLVLWIALLGALAAVRSAQHVSIDVLDKAAPPALRRVLAGLSNLLAMVFCAGMSWLAAGLLQMDMQAGIEWLPGISSAWTMVVIPLAFGLMALRFLIAAIKGPAAAPPATAMAAPLGTT